MADLAEFSQAGFDPKAWINASCAARPQEEPLDRYLAELEMKLQLTAEDVEAALEMNCNRILQRIPAAVQEISRIKVDVGTLQGDTQRILETLEVSYRKAASSAAPLATLNMVKERMEGACNTLTEATELSNLFGSVEEIFATGNLPRVAEVLSTMRNSLAVVGDVPEFNDGWKQLEVLENRLIAMVEGPLAGALAHKKGDMVRQLVGILTAVGQYSVVEKHFVTARMAQLQTFWDGFDRLGKDNGDFVRWLPRFYDEVLMAVEGEARWCQAVLPELHPRLLLAMLNTLFQRIRDGFVHRLSTSAEPGGQVQPSTLADVITAQLACLHFSRSLMGTVSDLSNEQTLELVSALLEPFQPYLVRYGELEEAVLSNEVSAIGLENSTGQDMDVLITLLANGVSHIIAIIESSVERCMKFTGGAEISALLRVADQALAAFCGQLGDVIKKIRTQCISDPAKAQGTDKAKEDGDEWRDLGEEATKDTSADEEAVGIVMQLLTVANSLVGQVGVLEAQMHLAVGEAAAAVEGLSAGVQSLDGQEVAANPLQVTVAARLTADSRLAAGLKSLMGKIQDQRYNSLPSATQRASGLQQVVNTLVSDTLMHKVVVQLAGVSKLPTWAEGSADNAFHLPSFSAYPQGYVSAVGEYLMTLPQQLEAWMAGGDTEEMDTHIDVEWLDKIATGAAELYAQELLQITKLSPKGVQQLSADLEYFCNVLSALSVPPPLALATIQVATTFQEADFKSSSVGAPHQQSLDRKALEAIATMRNLSIQ